MTTPISSTTTTSTRQRKSGHKSSSDNNDKNEKSKVKKGIQITNTVRTVGSTSSNSSSISGSSGSSRKNNAYNVFLVVNMLLIATGILVFSYTIISVRSNARTRSSLHSHVSIPNGGTTTSSSDTTTKTFQQEQEQEQEQEPQLQQEDEQQIQDDVEKKDELIQQVTRLGSYILLETLPHDTKAFTQGLVTITCPSYDNINTTTSQSYFIEGTGLNGESNVRLVSIETGIVLQQHTLSYKYFGEGITTYTVVDDDDEEEEDSTFVSTTLSNHNHNQQQQPTKQFPKQRIIQITWQEETAFLYDLSFDSNCIPTITKVKNNKNSKVSKSHSQQDKYKHHTQNQQQQQQQFKYKTPTTTTEGWGITYRNDLHIFYVSDGSSNIHIWDGTTFEQINIISITYVKSNDPHTKLPLNHINELEWDPITKTILCNVWYQNIIVRICPITGHVLRIYNVQSLYTNRPSTVDCLNGIALVPNNNNTNTNTNTTTNQIYVTGKLWPNLYRIQLIDHPTNILS